MTEFRARNPLLPSSPLHSFATDPSSFLLRVTASSSYSSSSSCSTRVARHHTGNGVGFKLRRLTCVCHYVCCGRPPDLSGRLELSCKTHAVGNMRCPCSEPLPMGRMLPVGQVPRHCQDLPRLAKAWQEKHSAHPAPPLRCLSVSHYQHSPAIVLPCGSAF